MLKLATFVVKDGPFDALDAAGWVARLCSTLTPLHERGLFHGRISTKAVYASRREAEDEGVLLDYDELPSDLAFHSRERLGGAGPSAADDVWAAGVVLYQLLTGTLPFEGASPRALKDRMAEAPPAPLAVFDVGDDRLQMILDRIFGTTDDRTIEDAATLRRALIDWSEVLASLPALDVGAQAMAEVDEDDEDPTHVFEPGNDPEVAKVLERARQERKARKRAREASPDGAEGEPKPAPEDEEAVAGEPEVPEKPAADVVPLAEPVDGDEAPATPEELPADVAAATEHAQAAAALPPDPERSRVTRGPILAAIGLVCVVVGGYGAFSLFGASSSSTARTPAPTVASSPGAVAPAPVPSAPASVVARPPAPTTTAPPTSEPSAPEPPPPEPAPPPPEGAARGDTLSCLVPLLAEDTFGTSRPDMGFVCEGDDPIAGMKKLRMAAVIAGAGRGTTAGKREWSELRWYMMAAFGVVRAHCCPEAPPLRTSPRLAECKFDERLASLTTAIERGDEAQATKALDEYTEAVRCLSRAGAARAFGQSTEPSSIGLRAFRRIFRRALAANR